MELAMNKVAQSGFSMLEMLISVAIMATMASILFPMAHYHYRQGIMTQYQAQAGYFLKHARIIAMEKGRNVSFCQKNISGQYILELRLRGSAHSNVCSGEVYRTLPISSQDGIELVTHLSGYYDPRGKYQGGAHDDLCLHNHKNHLRFTLSAYGLAESKGSGVCP
jgi:prepilin-type N-terminal cleavage/methylation domain-containing protein